MFSEIQSEAVAVLLMRTVTGILFFFQAYDKIFKVKIANVVKTFSIPFSIFHLSPAILTFTITVSSYIELAGGAFLFFGLFKNISLYFLAADMVFVAFTFSMVKAMWDMQYFFPRMILVVLLLFTLHYNDMYSLDFLFH